MFLGTSTLQTAATTRCDEFTGCLKGQEGHGGPIQHCLGRENLPVDISYPPLWCLVLGAQPHLL